MWLDEQVRDHAKIRWIPYRETHATFVPSAWLSTAGIMAWFLQHLASCGPRGRQEGSRGADRGANQHVSRLTRPLGGCIPQKLGSGRDVGWCARKQVGIIEIVCVATCSRHVTRVNGRVPEV